nr:hypothetical protein [Tanacetum cinerariifolium]
HGSLAGPDPEPTHDKFMADLYPKDAFAIEAQFINDKSTEDELKKTQCGSRSGLHGYRSNLSSIFLSFSTIYANFEATRPLPVVKGKGKAVVTEEQATESLLALHTLKRKIITDQFILQRWTLTTEEASIRPSAQPLDDTSANIVRDSPSLPDAETG